ncbi:hypothetical protein ABZ071_26965 [Micromonospora fulviviridis]|uniref:Uncharacterized protein n=1 Tax=Micromonospora fulviviridis TaxID=47860 RepID=A0ABV2VRQ2_9ACTN
MPARHHPRRIPAHRLGQHRQRTPRPHHPPPQPLSHSTAPHDPTGIPGTLRGPVLKVEYEAALPSLSIHLSGLMYEAMRDLFHLNPHDGPSPREMFERFVAWGHSEGQFWRHGDEESGLP